MIRGAIARWWGQRSTRLRISRVVVIVGVLLALFGTLTGRYGLLFAGIIVVGVGASLGPGRIRRPRE